MEATTTGDRLGRRRFAVIVTFGVLILSSTLHGAPADLIVSGPEYCLPILPIYVPQPGYGIEWGNLWSEAPPIEEPGIAVIAPGGHGRLLAMELFDFYGFNILEVRADRTRTLLFSKEGYAGLGLVAGANGAIYVLAANPLATVLYVLSPEGVQTAAYPLGAGSQPEELQKIDLASDQCTLYYVGHSSGLKRFDVCTGTPLADSPVPNLAFRALLPNGDILMSGTGAQLLRYSHDGLLRRTYSLGHSSPGGPFIVAVGLTKGGKHAVAQYWCEERQTDEIDLDSGVVTRRPELLQTVKGGFHSIVPVDGWTAALGPHAAIATTDIPTLWQSDLIVLTAFLAFVALRRLS